MLRHAANQPAVRSGARSLVQRFRQVPFMVNSAAMSRLCTADPDVAWLHKETVHGRVAGYVINLQSTPYRPCIPDGCAEQPSLGQSRILASPPPPLELETRTTLCGNTLVHTTSLPRRESQDQSHRVTLHQPVGAKGRFSASPRPRQALAAGAQRRAGAT